MRAAVLIAALLATPAMAQDYSANSEAKGWGLQGEEKARFKASVHDALCVLTGDCPDDCGAGQRQMALVREDDGQMILVLKNAQPVFSGATHDLAAFCGQSVEVDGLMVGDSEITPALGEMKVYLVQTVTVDGETTRANGFVRAWEEEHPDATGKGPWFRRDPAILQSIEERGYTGLGPQRDAEFIESWQ